MLRKPAALVVLSSLVATVATWAVITFVATPNVGAATKTCPSPTASNSPCVKFATRTGTVDVSTDGSYVDVGSVFLEPGKWLITARLEVGTDDGNAQDTIPCQLQAGAETEKSWVSVPLSPGTQFTMDSPPLDRTATEVLTIVHNFKNGGDAIVACNGGRLSPDDVQARDLRISAMRVGTMIKLPAA